MSYILTAQRRDLKAYARYQSYIASVRDQLPPGAYSLASSDWYFALDQHRGPHDARLEHARISETPGEGDGSRRRVSISIRLLGAYHDGHIELHYPDVSRYRIELQSHGHDTGMGHRDWRYDEFRLAPGNRVEHEIEWWGVSSTGTWLIEAADVEYRWIPLEQDSGARKGDV